MEQVRSDTIYEWSSGISTIPLVKLGLIIFKHKFFFLFIPVIYNLSNMRKVIAKRLTESKQSAPHF